MRPDAPIGSESVTSFPPLSSSTGTAEWGTMVSSIKKETKGRPQLLHWRNSGSQSALYTILFAESKVVRLKFMVEDLEYVTKT